MITREKNRDEFFTKIWKGVKGLWKVLKPQSRLPISWVDSDDKDLDEWSYLKEDGYDAGSASDSIL